MISFGPQRIYMYMYYELNVHARRTRVPCEYSRVPLAADIDVFCC